ncbi:RpoL/Rpb11 RNA polymerase subunit family protein [Nanoarchaeota archaeon]
MITKVLKNEKNYLEVELANLTIAEVTRKFLWDDSSVVMAAWKRDHPTKNPILVVKTSGKSAKKALTDTLEKMKKLNEKVLSEAKKIKK